MSTPSPGPGWWLASDGNWYPQRWEYRTFSFNGSGNDPNEAIVVVKNQANEYGQEGWELVNFTMDPLRDVAVAKGQMSVQVEEIYEHRQWTAHGIFKRPIAP
jgi:hypothetical protein